MPQVDTSLDDSANRTSFDVGSITDLNAKVVALGSGDPLSVVVDHGLDRVPVLVLPSKKADYGDYRISAITAISVTIERDSAFPVEFLII